MISLRPIPDRPPFFALSKKKIKKSVIGDSESRMNLWNGASAAPERAKPPWTFMP